MKSPGREYKQEKERATEGALRDADTQGRGDREGPASRRAIEGGNCADRRTPSPEVTTHRSSGTSAKAVLVERGGQGPGHRGQRSECRWRRVQKRKAARL